MVLDTSGSMGPDNNDAKFDRLGKVKKAAARFIRYDVEDEVPLGVVTFNGPNTATTRVPVSSVTNDNREDALGEINKLVAKGGTCMSQGLREGLAALGKWGDAKGGVLIFLTDGQYMCQSSSDTDWDDFNDVLSAIQAQGVRVVTIAFSNNADGQIETLAKETNGASFFVTDTQDPADINAAFAGVLAFQPGVNSTEEIVTLLQETHLQKPAVELNYVVDAFSGRDVDLQLDINTAQNVMISVDGDTPVEFSPDNEVFEIKWPTLALGEHKVTLTTTAGQVMETVSARVTSKAPEGSLPLDVQGWTRYFLTFTTKKNYINSM